MSFPYYRFFVGDYDRDTRHLSMLQHGAYRLLIDAYMAHGPLPNDLNRLNRTCGAFNAEERSAIELILTEFFTLDGPFWVHKRCESEREWQKAKHDASTKANAMRWQSERISEWTPNQNQNQNQKLEVEVEVKKKQKKNQIPALSDSEIEIKIPIIGGEFPISKAYAIELDALYPDADVRQTLREIRGWNLSNPTKRKTASGVLRHVNSWFAKVQNG